MAENTEPEATQAKGEKVAQYVGTADVRKISKADWKSLGIEQDALEWNLANGHKVPLKGLHKDAVAYLTEKDDGFKIVEA